ncbi:acyl transferase/acyl hydrolase/lysophospholipase [Trichophaea hybrida]|nr:acyl transferase/acyl hydrolase/lysophospholipase [Trichophaea hybrida]
MSGSHIIGARVPDIQHQRAADRHLASKQYILSLDGGGIRAYSSLLVLKALMEKIAQLENETPHLRTQSNNDDTSTHRIDDNLPLPCHYFDYIFGTGTGGLLAIMLGRLRMNVDACLSMFSIFGSRILGNSRRTRICGNPFKSKRLWTKAKYDSKAFEKFLREMIKEVVMMKSRDGQLDQFPSDENQCKTVVVCVMETLVDYTPFLLRSYANPGNLSSQYIRNPGMAYNTRIWKVARAAMAAPAFFSPMNVDGTTFLDGSYGHNNPSKLAYDEVKEIHRGRIAGFPIKVMVNIGTGRKASVGNNTNGNRGRTDVGHNFHTLPLKERNRFNYYRLDVQNGLQDMDMDEWRKDGSTLVTIARYTSTYLGSPQAQDDLTRAARQLVDARITRERLWTADQKMAFYEDAARKTGA